MKVCRDCGQEKPFTDFAKMGTCRDGYRPSCKSCCNARWYVQYQKKQQQQLAERDRKVAEMRAKLQRLGLCK